MGGRQVHFPRQMWLSQFRHRQGRVRGSAACCARVGPRAPAVARTQPHLPPKAAVGAPFLRLRRPCQPANPLLRGAKRRSRRPASPRVAEPLVMPHPQPHSAQCPHRERRRLPHWRQERAPHHQRGSRDPRTASRQAGQPRRATREANQVQLRPPPHRHRLCRRPRLLLPRLLNPPSPGSCRLPSPVPTATRSADKILCFHRCHVSTGARCASFWTWTRR
jgi:hypothetical protein